ncbi:MAG: DUF4307 domain-containing protein [Mycobacteriaceae bacterium]
MGSTSFNKSRYGSGRQVNLWRQSKTTWSVAIGTALTIGIGIFIAYLGYNNLGNPPVSGKQIGYRIIDPSTMSLQFTVTRDNPSQPAVCIIRSRSQDGAEVGRREVLIPASPDTIVDVTSVVRSTRLPAVGDVFGCSLTIPSYLVFQQ